MRMTTTTTQTEMRPTYEPTGLTSKADWTSEFIDTDQQPSTAPQIATDEDGEDMLDYLYLLFLLFVPGGGGAGYILKRCLAKRRGKKVQVREENRNDIGEIVMDVAEEVIGMCEVQGQGGSRGSEVDVSEEEIDTSVQGASGGSIPTHVTTKKELTVNLDDSEQPEKVGVPDEELARLMRSKLAGSSVGQSKLMGGARPKTFVIKKMKTKVKNFNEKKRLEKEASSENMNNLVNLEEGRLRSGKSYQKKVSNIERARERKKENDK